MLETKRFKINAPVLSDLDNWYQLQANPEVMRYVGGPRNRATIIKWLEQDISHYAAHGFCVGSVFSKKNEQFIGRSGMVYLNYDSDQSDIEIGYMLHVEQWGKGFAQELVNALIDWGFSELGFDKLMAITNPDNKRSQHVLKKAGMQWVKCIRYHNESSDAFEIYSNREETLINKVEYPHCQFGQDM
ncbi:MAG: GNAT family N-acetyltransferase [Legionella sp.]|jgi:ribosomal-protein-alanine N-acetyltransferase